MDTLTPRPDGEISGGGSRQEFLPPASPMEMAPQALQTFKRGEDQEGAANSVGLRRACILAGTAAMSIAGCYLMYEVLQVGGVTTLEWMVLGLFVLLFTWIAFSFMSALAGFMVLLFRIRDPLGIDPDAPLPLAPTNATVSPD